MLYAPHHLASLLIVSPGGLQERWLLTGRGNCESCLLAESVQSISAPLCRSHLQSLLDYVSTGQKEGATLVYGGTQLDRPGEYHHGQPRTAINIWTRRISEL